MMRGGLIALAAIGGALLAMPAQAQDLHALVVGINEYRYVSSLRGAVNDARQLADALKPLAKQTRILLDAQATRDNVMAAWRDILATARPGDTVIWTYAGHGGQEPELIPGEEADGKDEVLILVGYDAAKIIPAERKDKILDNELETMFDDARKKGLRVIFLADACNSGTMSRAIASGSAPVLTRYQAGYDIDADLAGGAPPPPPRPSGGEKTTSFTDKPNQNHVIYISAGVDGQAIPEFPIDGQQHGALSWSMTRALSGHLLGEAGGRVTASQLSRYLLNSIRGFAEAKQDPTIVTPAGRPDEVLFVLPPKPGLTTATVPPVRLAMVGEMPPQGRGLARDREASPPPPQQQTPTPTPPAPAFARGGDSSGLILSRLAGVISAPPEAADLIWDSTTGLVTAGPGDRVAEQVKPEGLQAIVDKYRALRLIRDLAPNAALTSRLEPSEGVYVNGAKLTYRLTGLNHGHLILFNLAPDGTLQFLYPLAGDPPVIDAPAGFALKLVSQPPFGAEHLVALVLDRPAPGLIRQLQTLNDTKPGDWLVRDLQRYLKGLSYQIDAHALFTAATAP